MKPDDRGWQKGKLNGLQGRTRMWNQSLLIIFLGLPDKDTANWLEAAFVVLPDVTGSLPRRVQHRNIPELFLELNTRIHEFGLNSEFARDT